MKKINLVMKTRQYNTIWYKPTCSRLYISYKTVSFTRISLSIWLQILTTGQSNSLANVFSVNLEIDMV